MMKHIFLLVFLLVGFSSFAFSQTSETEKTRTELTVCPVKLTEAGKQPNFQFNYIYFAETDADGAVTKVRQIHKEHPKFINDEDFIPCIEKWKLSPLQKTIVTFFVGTTGEQKFISISNKKEFIKILL